MLQFSQTDTDVQIVLTLSENKNLAVPYYLFVFTHVTTKDTVQFIKSVADDQSGYQNRYNQFAINPSVVFAGKQPGEWHYKVYEQESDTNLDPLSSGAVLEYGKMILNRNPDFFFDKYEQQTVYKTWDTDFGINKYDTPTTYKTYNPYQVAAADEGNLFLINQTGELLINQAGDKLKIA